MYNIFEHIANFATDLLSKYHTFYLSITQLDFVFQYIRNIITKRDRQMNLNSILLQLFTIGI